LRNYIPEATLGSTQLLHIGRVPATIRAGV